MADERRKLPALDNASKLKKPDFPDIADKNYTDKILKYGGLATKFPQLNTEAKTVVGAINELQAGGSGDGKHRTLTQAEYDDLSEEEKNNGTIYFISDAGGGGGGGGQGKLGDCTDCSFDNAINGAIIYGYQHDDGYGHLDTPYWKALVPSADLGTNGAVLYFIANQVEHQEYYSIEPKIGKLSPEFLSSSYASMGQIIQFDGIEDKWVVDREIEQPQDGDALVWDENDSRWVNAKISVEHLGNVNISSIQNGDTLVWDSNSNCWVNGSSGGGGGSGVNAYHVTAENAKIDADNSYLVISSAYLNAEGNRPGVLITTKFDVGLDIRNLGMNEFGYLIEFFLDDYSYDPYDQSKENFPIYLDDDNSYCIWQHKTYSHLVKYNPEHSNHTWTVKVSRFFNRDYIEESIVHISNPELIFQYVNDCSFYHP